jgi:hypothetical protein
MSIDTVNEALTAVRVRIAASTDNSFSVDGKQTLIDMCNVWRDKLMAAGLATEVVIANFNSSIDRYLAARPDTTVFLLDELFAELGFPDYAGRGHLDVELDETT